VRGFVTRYSFTGNDVTGNDVTGNDVTGNDVTQTENLRDIISRQNWNFLRFFPGTPVDSRYEQWNFESNLYRITIDLLPHIARWPETSFTKFNRHEYYTAVSYIIRLGNVRIFKIIWSSKENMVQFFKNQGQRSKTVFTQKFIEYQISIIISCSLKKDEKLHIWFSLLNLLSKTSDVIKK
jgi:hypothetical protein